MHIVIASWGAPATPTDVARAGPTLPVHDRRYPCRLFPLPSPLSTGDYFARGNMRLNCSRTKPEGASSGATAFP